jgi:hypothetical protein
MGNESTTEGNMSSKLRILAMLCSIGLVVAACGGGNSDADLIAAVEASMDGDVDAFEGIDFDSSAAPRALSTHSAEPRGPKPTTASPLKRLKPTRSLMLTFPSLTLRRLSTRSGSAAT